MDPPLGHAQAASAFLSLMLGVEDLARVVSNRVGMGGATLECFTGTSFELTGADEDVAIEVQPDGIIELNDGNMLWRALVEVTIGDNQFEATRVNRAHRLAKQLGFDALITIGNQPAAEDGQPPVAMGDRRLQTVPAYHFSWETLFHEAQLLAATVEQTCEKWVLKEWLAFMDNPVHPITSRYGLGPFWDEVESMAQSGSLGARDKSVLSVAQAWRGFLKDTAKRFTIKLGKPVTVQAPDMELVDEALQAERIANRLANSQTLSGRLRGAGSHGNLSLSLTPKTGEARFSIDLQVASGTEIVKWLRRLAVQLKRVGCTPDDELRIYWDHKSTLTRSSVVEFIKDPLSLQRLPGGWDVSQAAKPIRAVFQQTVQLQGEGKCSSAQLLDGLSNELEGFCNRVVQPMRSCE